MKRQVSFVNVAFRHQNMAPFGDKDRRVCAKDPTTAFVHLVKPISLQGERVSRPRVDIHTGRDGHRIHLLAKRLAAIA